MARRFYSNQRYRELDQSLRKAYAWKNPYRICKEYLREAKAEEIHAYGETPITTMARIAKECAIGVRDLVVELGAGRGRAALFLAEYVGCAVKAYEQVPEFAHRLRNLKIERVEVVQGDFFQEKSFEADVIYLYGTMLSDREISHLAQHLPRSAKIITVSYSLEDYSGDYRVIKSFPGRFPWGETQVYLNERFVK